MCAKVHESFAGTGPNQAGSDTTKNGNLMKLLTKAAGTTAATLCLLMVGGAVAAFAAPPPEHMQNGQRPIEGNGPAWIAVDGTTADQLRELGWFVREENGVFYYARHGWQEQRRAADYRFSRTVPAETRPVMETWHKFAQNVPDRDELRPVYENWTEYQYSKTIPAITETVPVYQMEYRFEITRPYWTVESKYVQAANQAAFNQLLAAFDRVDPTLNVGVTYANSGGWLKMPYQIVNADPTFNPATTAPTGSFNIQSTYGRHMEMLGHQASHLPNTTVLYEKYETMFFNSPPSDTSHYGGGATGFTQQLFWNGEHWVTSASAAAWVPLSAKPEGGVQYGEPRQGAQIGTEEVVVTPARTVWATADGGETENEADAAWLLSSPGAGWAQTASREESKQIGEEWVTVEPGHTIYATADGQHTRNPDEAEWMIRPPAGRGWEQIASEQRETGETEVVTPEHTVWATADGETTDVNEAAWLAEAPGAEWTQYGDAQLRDWATGTEWEAVIGYGDSDGWAEGNDPGEQPEYYEGYNSDTQRFRPEVEVWKIVLPVTPPIDPPVTPPTVPDPPALDTGGPEDPPALEAGGSVHTGIHPAVAIGLAGVLVAGGIAVPFMVTRRKARQQ